ncbi:MAG: hypothetical protein ACFFBY_01675 [Promethearchaeota archaeon]
MSNRKPEKNSEIWLKYCEECVKSKLEKNHEQLLDPSKEEQVKKVRRVSYLK